MPRRMARPLYEALPLLWALAGCACLAGSYLAREHAASGLLALAGLVLLVLALAVWMHRRDYRATAADYRLRGGELPDPLAAGDGVGHGAGVGAGDAAVDGAGRVATSHDAAAGEGPPAG